MADAFAGGVECLAHLFEGAGGPIVESVAQGEDFAFAVGEGREDVLEALLEEGVGGRFARVIIRFVSHMDLFLVVAHGVAPVLVLHLPRL